MIYVTLTAAQWTPELLENFHWDQSWKRQWMHDGVEWRLCEKEGRRFWTSEKRCAIREQLREVLLRGGCVVGAYDGVRLTGFAALEGALQGMDGRCAGLSAFYVDDDYLGQGVGHGLLQLLRVEAAVRGAASLFVSALPSEMTVAFYLSEGFRDAEEPIPVLAAEAEDRPMTLCL